MYIPEKYRDQIKPFEDLSQKQYDKFKAQVLSDPSLTFRWQVNRLGSRPGEFHPVKSVGLFESEESAQVSCDHLEFKSSKRSKYGPSQYVPLFVVVEASGSIHTVYGYNG